MSPIVLAAGALIAVDRGDRSMLARLKAPQDAGTGLRTSAGARPGSRACFKRLMSAPSMKPRVALRGSCSDGAGASTAEDAVLVLVAEPGDVILTNDTEEVGRLVDAAGARVTVAPR